VTKKSHVELEFQKKKRLSQHGEGTGITINKYVHENAIAEVLRVVHVHFIVSMCKLDYQ